MSTKQEMILSERSTTALIFLLESEVGLLMAMEGLGLPWNIWDSSKPQRVQFRRGVHPLSVRDFRTPSGVRVFCCGEEFRVKVDGDGLQFVEDAVREMFFGDVTLLRDICIALPLAFVMSMSIFRRGLAAGGFGGQKRLGLEVALGNYMKVIHRVVDLFLRRLSQKTVQFIIYGGLEEVGEVDWDANGFDFALEQCNEPPWIKDASRAR